MNYSDVICLLGPTAVGKTNYAIELVQKYNFEIISVDSAMVYKGMDVGTGKPSLEEQAKAPHRLIDVCNIADVYNVEKFCKDAILAINQVIQNNRKPLLVGGTMMYFKALQEGLSPLPGADIEVRQRIEREASHIGWNKMHAKLKVIDLESFNRINPNDAQRIGRALEVYEITGISLTNLITQDQTEKISPNKNFNFINYALLPEDRAKLHLKIKLRFLKMLEAGLIEEVEQFYNDRNIDADLPAMRSVGYRQVWEYLAGDIDKDQMIEKAISATRQLAKRQMTWLRSWKNLKLVEPNLQILTEG